MLDRIQKRNPEILWVWSRKKVYEYKGFEDHFKLQLIAILIKKIKKRLNISKFSKCVSFKGYISEKTAHSYIFKSAITNG